MFITDNNALTLLIRKRIAHITLLPGAAAGGRARMRMHRLCVAHSPARTTRTAEENQEAISILRYDKGQFYRPHQVLPAHTRAL
jgi:hypothetical protein